MMDNSDLIEELDVVAVDVDKPEKNLKAGTIGTVVHVHKAGVAYMVEFTEMVHADDPVIDLNHDEIHKASDAEIKRYRVIARAVRDKIILTRDIPKENLKNGDLGSVIFTYDYGGQKNYMAEFVSLTGETIAVLSLGTSDVRKASDTDLKKANEAGQT